MTVKDLMKRLWNIYGDKMVLFVDDKGGWSNIELIEKDNEVHIMCEKKPLFHDN